MSFSRRGETNKLLNRAGTSEKESRACYACSHMRQRETHDIGARLLFRSHVKKDCQQNILHGITPCASTCGSVCAGAPCACAQMDFHVLAQKAPRGGQAIRDLRSLLTIVGLKTSDHEF
jgi:hypothetical protein